MHTRSGIVFRLFLSLFRAKVVKGLGSALLFTAACCQDIPIAKAQTQNELVLSCLASAYRPDTMYRNQHSVRFLPLSPDSLFLSEEIHVSNYERLSIKEFERLMDKYQYQDFRSYYSRDMGRGIANQQVYQDFQHRTDNATDIKLTYIRYLIPNVASPYVKQGMISIAYSAYIPRTWEAQEKWNFSLNHFKQKVQSIEELFNDCRPAVAE